MDKNRMWLIGSAVVMVGVLIVGWFVAIQPQLALKASHDAQRVSVESQNAALEATIAVLKGDYESIDVLRSDLALLRESIPAAADISGFLTEIVGIATASETSVTSITVSDAVAYTKPASVASAPESPPVADSESSNSDDAAAATDVPGEPTEVPPVPTAPPIATDALITEENFIAIPISLSIGGSYENALNFLDQLQHGNRLFAVTQFSSSTEAGASVPDSETGDVAAQAAGGSTTTITGHIYVLLDN